MKDIGTYEVFRLLCYVAMLVGRCQLRRYRSIDDVEQRSL